MTRGILYRHAGLMGGIWAGAALCLAGLTGTANGGVAVILWLLLFAIGCCAGAVLSLRLLRGAASLWPVAPSAALTALAAAALAALPDGSGPVAAAALSAMALGVGL
ncbi:hypothetical protein EJA01_10210, partial [Rhodovulum iodosum]